LQKYFYIAIGGALGSVARYWVGSAVAGKLGARLPYGTFIVNITACLAIGFSLELLSKYAAFSPALEYLVPIGFIGAYSTFSTFEWETFANLQTGGIIVAGAYVASSVVLGLVAVWCGVLLAKIVP
jgi:fluoride exporter